jgi:hypothetical protein
VIGNVIDEDNAWNNYLYDYTGAPGAQQLVTSLTTTAPFLSVI